MNKPKFDPNKPFKVVEDTPEVATIKNKPKFDPSKPFTPIQEPSQEDISTFQKVLNVVDIPSSLVRTGVEAALSPEREVLPSLVEQTKRTIQSPTTASMQAPTGIDINKQIFPEIKEDSGLGQVGGFTTEMALDPLSWFRPSKSVTKPIQKSLNSASERQAAKALSKYATKTDVLKEGVDLDVLGSRLVSEDLQGLIRDPKKLYETLAGKRHLQKMGGDLPQTLQIRKSRSEGGRIAEASKEITDAISKVSSEYGLDNKVPADIMMKQLLESSKKNISAVSGETVDLDKVEGILQGALKPFKDTIIPPVIGKTEEGVLREANKISLPQLHELRKNIGQQVSDRAFWAGTDASMRLETEVLRDLYRNLGDVIDGSLRGKKLKVGNSVVDAGDYYKAQNNKLKSFMDIRSMLEYQPTEALKSPDLAATIAAMATKGSIYGATAAGASMAGLPVNPLAAGAVGAGFGMASAASDAVKTSTPEYLTSILKQAGKVSGTPLLPEAATRGTIQYMREGEFVPTQPSQSSPRLFETVKPAFPFGVPSEEQIRNMPSSTMLNPRQMIKYRIPRSTDGILQNKEMVLAKIAQAGVPDEMYQTIAYALNESPEQVSSVAPLIMTQYPNLFEQSKYKIFDGVITDPNDKARMADDISKRDDLNSIQRAKMIGQINKTGKVPEGIV
jgi:hypothetical protein